MLRRKERSLIFRVKSALKKRNGTNSPLGGFLQTIVSKKTMSIQLISITSLTKVVREAASQSSLLDVLTHAYTIARKEERGRPTEVPTRREMLNELNWNIFKCIQFVSDWGMSMNNPLQPTPKTRSRFLREAGGK